jgi:hypothetical protein
VFGVAISRLLGRNRTLHHIFDLVFLHIDDSSGHGRVVSFPPHTKTTLVTTPPSFGTSLVPIFLGWSS